MLLVAVRSFKTLFYIENFGEELLFYGLFVFINLCISFLTNY